MPDYLLLMHDDIPDGAAGDWQSYITALQRAGCFQGGSAIGGGICARKSGTPPGITQHLSGYIKVGADSLDQARALLRGNPMFEAGGTVEIRELPQTG